METEIMNNVEEVMETGMELIPEAVGNNKFGKAGKVGGVLFVGAAMGVAAYAGGKRLYKLAKKKAAEAKNKKEAETEDEEWFVTK